jgi:DNA replication initiation complex subunit (GINS family)
MGDDPHGIEPPRGALDVVQGHDDPRPKSVGRDVVVEAQQVLGVVAALDVPESLELRRPVRAQGLLDCRLTGYIAAQEVDVLGGSA